MCTNNKYLHSLNITIIVQKGVFELSSDGLHAKRVAQENYRIKSNIALFVYFIYINKATSRISDDES